MQGLRVRRQHAVISETLKMRLCVVDAYVENCDFYLAIFHEAFDSIVEAGIEVVTASGNANTDACRRPPGSAPLAFHEGTTNSTDARAATMVASAVTASSLATSFWTTAAAARVRPVTIGLQDQRRHRLTGKIHRGSGDNPENSASKPQRIHPHGRCHRSFERHHPWFGLQVSAFWTA